MKILGGMQTADSAWRVEIVRDRGIVTYRLVHGDNIIEGLSIATVQRLLAEAGVDMADLVEVPQGAPEANGTRSEVA